MTLASKCPKCDETMYFAEKVSSLGKDWHKFCLKCERCSKTLTPGGHAEVSLLPGLGGPGAVRHLHPQVRRGPESPALALVPHLVPFCTA